jgi:hypothetical protein
MTPDEFDSITCALLARCNVIIRDDGVDPCKFDLSKPAEIDTAFAGKLGLMVKTLAYVLEVHYAGFFRDLVFGVGGAAPEQPTT